MARYSSQIEDMPDLVYPDDARGHEECQNRGSLQEGLAIRFCDDYRKGEVGGRLCANREYRYDAENRQHSWCFRCPAGYAFVPAVEGQDPFREEVWSTEQRNIRPLW